MVRRAIRLVITAAIAIFIMYLIMVFVMPVELKLGIMMIVLIWIVAVCALFLWDEREERNDENDSSVAEMDDGGLSDGYCTKGDSNCLDTNNGKKE